MEEKKTRPRSVLNGTLMVISILVVLFLLPAVFMGGKVFEKFLSSYGVKISPNFNGGYLIAEFDDPSDDMLLSLPTDTLYRNAHSALDIRKFSVRKVKFNILSGIGLEPRMNLCFEFDGKQPNPFDFKNNFSFPVMHVYIKTPIQRLSQKNSNKTARLNFQNEVWYYQVIIDGSHEQARVFDNEDKYLFNGVGIYTHYEEIPDKTTKTIITAALPLDLIGDPSKGEWKFFVVVGLYDIRNPSMLFRIDKDSLDVFDYVAPDSVHSKMDAFGSIYPLIVNNSK
jgi:hypothetical protein